MVQFVTSDCYVSKRDESPLLGTRAPTVREWVEGLGERSLVVFLSRWFYNAVHALIQFAAV